jgi:biopolymer transport protein ExbD
MRTVLHATRAHDVSHGIDLAPMLDFVVNLLVFFIITAVLVKEVGVTLSRPHGSQGDSAAKTVVIDADGEIAIEGRSIDARAVRAHLERLRAENPAGGLVIVAHERAPTGSVVTVADQARLSGIDDITFSTAH